MSAPSPRTVWKVPAREGTSKDLLSNRLARRIGGPWAWGDDPARYHVWRVQDRVRLELTLEDRAEGGMQARLHGEPAYVSLRRGVVGLGCALAGLVAVLGALFSKTALYVGLTGLGLGLLGFAIARRPTSAEERELARQLGEVAAVLDDALGEPRDGSRG